MNFRWQEINPDRKSTLTSVDVKSSSNNISAISFDSFLNFKYHYTSHISPLY